MIFKGATYCLTPVNIPLALLVIGHNALIIHNYWPARVKFVPCLFMGIAVSDILNAQAQLMTSLISILVFAGVCDESVLYRSLYYYMVAGMPGYSTSRICYVALSLTLTVHLADPFRRLNFTRLRTITLVLVVFFTLLHVADMLCAVLYLPALQEIHNEAYVYLMMSIQVPGLITMGAAFQNSFDQPLKPSTAFVDVFVTTAVFDYFIPPLIILVCMVIQVVCLRRDRPSKAIGDLNRSSRHASVTIILTSLLFFLCHTTLFFLIIVWGILVRFDYNHIDDNKVPPFIDQGIALGISEFTLILINAAFYPIILIARKPQLRQQYTALYTRVRLSCT